VENPVEKVENLVGNWAFFSQNLRNGKTPPFFVVKWAGVRLHFAVTA